MRSASISRRRMRTQKEWKVEISGLASVEPAEQLLDALGHLGGGLVGEGDGEDGIRRDALRLNEIGDAVGDDAGLARAGAGQDEQRAVRGLDGGALLRIHLFEQGIHGLASRWGLLFPSVSPPAMLIEVRKALCISLVLRRFAKQSARARISGNEPISIQRNSCTTQRLRLLRVQRRRSTRSFSKRPERWGRRSPSAAGNWCMEARTLA